MAKGSQNGKSNNPSGRPKGIKSPKMKQWEQLGSFLTVEGAQRAKQILSTLDDEAYLDQYYKLLSYFKPKQVHNINEQKEPTKIIFENVSEKYKFGKDGEVIEK